MKYLVLTFLVLFTSSCQYKRTGKEQIISQSAEFSAGWALFSIKASFQNVIVNKQNEVNPIKIQQTQ